MTSIKSVLRDTLRAHLTPEMFLAVHRTWSRVWYLGFYIRRSSRALLVTERPITEGAGSLTTELQSVNVAQPTKFCRIMSRNGSDKGSGWHTYTTVYSRLLGHRVGEPLRIFELGIGTGTAGIAGNMGVSGRPGGSLRGWRELFRHAEVYGADIDRTVLFTDTRIQTFYCDQLDAEVIGAMWAQPVLRTPFDLIVDDGMHTFEANVSFLASSLEHLRPGGLYVVEDIRGTAIDRWRDYIRELQRKYPRHEIVLAQLPSPTNQVDNNLLIIRPS